MDKLSIQVLLELQVSQLRAELAQTKHELTLARVERDFAFRFADVVIRPDGSIERPAPSQ